MDSDRLARGRNYTEIKRKVQSFPSKVNSAALCLSRQNGDKHDSRLL